LPWLYFGFDTPLYSIFHKFRDGYCFNTVDTICPAEIDAGVAERKNENRELKYENGQDYGNANLLVELVIIAEAAGGEGFFIIDHIGDTEHMPAVDPWLKLAAIASRIQALRLGTMVTPLSRRKPWKVAREIVTLDHLSKGRAVLSVGLGNLLSENFKAFGEVTHPRQRSDMLDEGLQILAALQKGEPFSFQGKYYQVDNVMFKPEPIQQRMSPYGSPDTGRSNALYSARRVGMAWHHSPGIMVRLHQG
jgi:alkanesulfonate monooxygenase SsuD/methylene tetrahydromethanopterin reductase-like flavin-dependent oxidoreductase (luciferase family)